MKKINKLVFFVSLIINGVALKAADDEYFLTAQEEKERSECSLRLFDLRDFYSHYQFYIKPEDLEQPCQISDLEAAEGEIEFQKFVQAHALPAELNRGIDFSKNYGQVSPDLYAKRAEFDRIININRLKKHMELNPECNDELVFPDKYIFKKEDGSYIVYSKKIDGDNFWDFENRIGTKEEYIQQEKPFFKVLQLFCTFDYTDLHSDNVFKLKKENKLGVVDTETRSFNMRAYHDLRKRVFKDPKGIVLRDDLDDPSINISKAMHWYTRDVRKAIHSTELELKAFSMLELSRKIDSVKL